MRGLFSIKKWIFLSLSLCFLFFYSHQAVSKTPATAKPYSPLPLVVSVQLEVKPEKRDLFLELATAALEPTRAEPGVISYGFYEEPSKPNSFIYYEEWKNQQALVEHLAQPYVKKLLDKFPELIKGDVRTRRYQVSTMSTKLTDE